MSVVQLIHYFWVWGIGGLAGAATVMDAIRGFKWTRSICGNWFAKMFGAKLLANEFRAALAATNAVVAENTKTLQLIAKEMAPNSGSSLRDAINQIRIHVEQIDIRQVAQYERVKALSMDAPVGVQEFNPEGEMIWCNRTYLRMIGRNASETLGWGWINSVHPSDRDKVKENWLSSVQKQMAYESEYRILQPNGKATRISVRATVMRNDATVLGYVTTVTPALHDE